jgi:hypothetical protein
VRLSSIFTLHLQAANIEAEGSGIHDAEYQLTKHEFSGLGRGKYSGTYDICLLILSSFAMYYSNFVFDVCGNNGAYPLLKK